MADSGDQGEPCALPAPWSGGSGGSGGSGEAGERGEDGGRGWVGATVLHLCAGEKPREGGISGWMRVMGGAGEDVDTGLGGASHDLSLAHVEARLAKAIRQRRYDVVGGGGPCGTFSPIHDPQLRDTQHPEGLEGLPQWAAHVQKANGVWRALARLARAAHEAGGEFFIEHPQRRDVRGERAYWEEQAAVATPGDLPELLALERDTGAVRINFAQCALGSKYQKFTTLLCSPRLAAQLVGLQGACCSRCLAHLPHAERARGRFADGSSRAAAAAAYPSEMCRAIAAAVVACPIGERRGDAAADDDDGASSEDGMPRLLSSGDEGDSGAAAQAAATAGSAARTADRPAARRTTSWSQAVRFTTPPTSHVHGGAGWQPELGGLDASEDESDDDVLRHLGGGLGDEGDNGRPEPLGTPSDEEATNGDGFGALAQRAVRVSVAAARRKPARFASLRNLAAADAAELRSAPMPHIAPRQTEAQPAPSNAAPPAEGQGGRPRGKLHITQLFAPGVYERVRRWREQAQSSLRDILAGRHTVPPATLVITQMELQPFARGVIWDTRDADDCRPMRASTRDDVVGGEATIDRAAVRAAAAELDWPHKDLIGQVGEGGVEARSECSWDTVLAFHHPGLAENVQAAAKIVEGDIGNGSVIGGFHELPSVPCRSLPRDVVMQQRSRVLEDGSIEDYEKPRVTTNSSEGKDELGSDGLPRSVNDGVPAHEKAVLLPAIRQLGRGAGIVAQAGKADGLRALAYCFDLKSAYRYVPVQWLNWWQHVFYWVDARGVGGWYIDISGAFGGAYMPERFEGLTDMAMELSRRRQDAFDAEHPYPPGVQEWQRERRALQRRGMLPEGAAQIRPAYAQVYLDDGSGVALDDAVEVPERLLGIGLGELATRALGGEPAARNSRAAVHLCLAIEAFESLGFLVEVTKTECGSAIVNLGFRLDLRRERIDCPLPKRRILRRDIGQLRQQVADGEAVQQKGCERLVGRLANLSHVLPELAQHLSGGYAVAAATAQPRRAARAAGEGVRRAPRRRLGEVRVRRGGRCEAALGEMCEVSEQLLDNNEGIAMAAAAEFAPASATTTLTVVTDASGEDGVGGYAFSPAAPRTMWLMADEWPPDVRASLARAAAPRAERAAAAGTSMCSMPLAELFGSWAMAEAAMRGGAEGVAAVIAVGDCAPAAAVLTAATSAGAQLRALAVALRKQTQQWLGVQVPRELNTHADTLSHPARWEEVAAEARAAGYEVRRVHAPRRCWAALRQATALQMGREAAGWREAGEVAWGREAARGQ